MRKQDQDFDRLLAESIGEAPPEEEIGKTKPWRIPFQYITSGIFLMTFQINYLGLQYLFPMLGVLLIYLGFRSLRRENKWFQAAWIYSIANMGIFLAGECISASPLRDSANLFVWQIIGIFLNLIFLLIFRRAVKEVFRKAEQEEKGDPLLGAVIWYLVLAVLGFRKVSAGLLLLLAFGVCLLLILRSLRNAAAGLDDAGYCISNAPVKVGAKWIAAGYGLMCLTAVGVTCVVSNHLSVDGTEFVRPEATVQRQKLAEKGFPEEILACLSDQEVSLMDGPVYVDVDRERMVFEEFSGRPAEAELAEKNSVASVTVTVEKEGGEIYVIHYFDWEERKAYWQDGFTIWAGMEDVALELISGALFYELEGTEYTAQFPRLRIGEVQTVSVLAGSIPQKQIYGALSYPFGSVHQRGLIFYKLELRNENQWLEGVIFNYAHQTHPFHLNYLDTEQGMIKGLQEFKQHYTLIEMETYRKKKGIRPE